MGRDVMATLRLMIAAFLLASVGSGLAQPVPDKLWPSRQIEVIIAFPPAAASM
jgi:hypothetical protein